MNFSTCKDSKGRKGCGAPIIWIKTQAGKNHPLDREPEKMWVMTLRGEWKIVDCYRTHFASCPHANEFRENKS